MIAEKIERQASWKAEKKDAAAGSAQQAAPKAKAKP